MLKRDKLIIESLKRKYNTAHLIKEVNNAGYLSIEEAEKKIDELIDKYVPASGMADTVGGEILRAFARLYYRCYNDGDVPYEGYGNETCNSSYRFLKEFSFFDYSPIKDIPEDNPNEWYERLQKTLPELYKWITGSGKGWFTVKNNTDSRKPSEEDLEWEKYYWDDEDEYYEEEDYEEEDY